jgi:DNA-binding MarR family transcriptional regulator
VCRCLPRRAVNRACLNIVCPGFESWSHDSFRSPRGPLAVPREPLQTPASPRTSERPGRCRAHARSGRPAGVSRDAVLASGNRARAEVERRQLAARASSEFDVLATLRRAGAPYSAKPSALARTLLLSPAGTTSRLDRLEALGFIARRATPNDRRSSTVVLTAKGLAVIDAAIADHVANEARLLAPLTATERRTRDELLRTMLAQFEGPQKMTKAPRQSGLEGSEANPHRGLCPMPPHWAGFVAVRVSGLTPFLSAPQSAWVQAPRQLTRRGYATRRPTYPRSVYAYRGSAATASRRRARRPGPRVAARVGSRCEEAGQLRDEWDLANRGVRLGCNASGGRTAVGAR